MTPGNPATTFERELHDLAADPYEQGNVGTALDNAARVTAMGLRLRELRPNRPIDSDPNRPDRNEDD